MQNALLPNIQSCGQLLPLDALRRILDRDKAMLGMADADYHLAGERQNEAVNRAWQKMLSLWRGFSQVLASLAASEAGTTQTRENFLLPLFQESGHGRLSAAKTRKYYFSNPGSLVRRGAGTSRRFNILKLLNKLS